MTVSRKAVQDIVAVACLAALIAVAFFNVLFAGKWLVITDNRNPLDYRHLAQNCGPGVPSERSRFRKDRTWYAFAIGRQVSSPVWCSRRPASSR